MEPNARSDPARGDAAGPEATPFDLYIWERPGDVDESQASDLVRGWLAGGGDPARSPFDATVNIGWFFRELQSEQPDIDAVTDAVPRQTRVPVWASGSDEAPARVVAIRLPRGAGEPPRALVDSIVSLAAKYDLVVFNPYIPRVDRPLRLLAEHTHATFWPRGAIQAAVAGAGGAILAVVAWFLGIPILSGVLVVIGLFMAVLSVITFVGEGRRALRRGGFDTEG